MRPPKRSKAELDRLVQSVSNGQWTECRIKSKPVVKKEVENSSGKVVKTRSVEHMISIFKRRVRKSEKLEEYHKRRHYKKPSTKRRDDRRDAEYRLKKKKRRRRN